MWEECLLSLFPTFSSLSFVLSDDDLCLLTASSVFLLKWSSCLLSFSVSFEVTVLLIFLLGIVLPSFSLCLFWSDRFCPYFEVSVIVLSSASVFSLRWFYFHSCINFVLTWLSFCIYLEVWSCLQSSKMFVLKGSSLFPSFLQTFIITLSFSWSVSLVFFPF